MSKIIPAFWWKAQPNFGDLLTKTVFSQQGINVRWSSPRLARLIGIGSILEHLPEDSTATILGAGLMHQKNGRGYPSADFLAVRGKLTAKLLKLNLKDIALGDPGLILKIEENFLEKKFRIGLVPHYVDKKNSIVINLKNRLGAELTVIDVENANALATAREIAACSAILSSSLHGLVVAWGLGIPCAWIQLSDLIVGKGFKFHDFYSVFNIKYASPRKLQGFESISKLESFCTPPPRLIAKRQRELILAFEKARSKFVEIEKS